MKFLIISQNAGSRKHGMVLRNYNWAKKLVDMGHDVTIAATSFSHSRQTQPIHKGLSAGENIDGVKYIWLWGPEYSAKSAIGRILSMFIFVAQLFLSHKKFQEDYDVIVVSSPPPFAIYPAYYLAKKQKAKLVFDARDLWPLTLKELGGYSPRHPFIWLMQKAEDFACRNADLVTAVAANSENYLESRGLEEGKFLPLGNGLLDMSSSKATDPLPKLLHELQNIRAKARFTVGYTGALGIANAMHAFINAMAHTSNDIHALIIGDGPERVSLQTTCDDLGIQDRVHFIGSVKPDEVATCLSYMDCAYVGLLKKDFYKYGASLTKLNDYMEHAKPIIYAAQDSGNAVVKSECGISCEAESVKDITTAMETMAEMSAEERHHMGLKGQAWLRNNNMVHQHMDRLLAKLGFKTK